MTQPFTNLSDAIDLPSNLSLRHISTVSALPRATFELEVPFRLAIPEDAHVDPNFHQLVEAAQKYSGVVSINVQLSLSAEATLLSGIKRSGFLSAPDLCVFWVLEKETA